MGRVSLAWLLAQEGVTAAVVGARNAAQARDNALAADLSLDAETLALLSAATEGLKQHIGLNADMWQTPSRMERRYDRPDGGTRTAKQGTRNT